jgi:carbonic anhydrase/acetyltransferase-like protein (isoleucine patch superfamily)
MGAIILNDVRIGTGSFIAAGTVVTEHTLIPPGSMVMGVPGTVRRPLTDEELARIDHGSEAYFRLKEQFLAERRGSP